MVEIQIRALEREWEKSISVKNTKSAPLLTIGGPSGAGKTTVVTAFMKSCFGFVEKTEGNPYLEGLLIANRGDFAANQEWFLDRVHEFISNASTALPVVLDQDPAAIVFVYARIFLKQKRISDAQYVRLLEKLQRVEATLRRWRTPRITLFLDAPAEELHARVQQRNGIQKTPSIEWFDCVRKSFNQFSKRLPHAVRISTGHLPSEKIISRASEVLKSLL